MKITRLPNQIFDKVYDIDSLCEYLKINRCDLFIFKEDTINKHERFINASNIIIKVVEVYNEGIILDWKNIHICKYLPYINFSGDSGVVSFDPWYYHLHCSAGCYYKSIDLAQEGYKNFKSYYEDYWQINN